MTRAFQIRRKSFALGILEELSVARSTDALCRAVERTAREVARASAGRLYLYDAETQQLTRQPSDGPPSVLELSGRALAAQCAAACQPLLEEGERPTAVALPLVHHAALAGVLEIEDMRLPPHESLLETLGELCTVSAALLASVSEIEGLERLQARTQDGLVRAQEALEPASAGHVARVGAVSAELASLLDLSTRARRLLWEAAQYHDVGRLLLAGNSPADIERHHARAGAEYLRENPRLAPVAALVEAHHLPYDAAAHVPLEGWVLALAEDLEEARRQADGRPAAEWIGRFVDARADIHHPDAVDALRELLRRSRLATLYP